jgi:glycine/D-amino acid oxidase-like deaminating enzyme
VASSHIVLTEPVPDVLEEIGWTGGEAIVDSRTFLHYLRTTPDGRIAFGWAGGHLAAGGRPYGRIERDPRVAAEAIAHLRRFFPQLEGRAITHAWGGPIDVSASHLPVVDSLPGGRAFAVAGLTGDGVAPSHLLGRVLAALARDRREEPVTKLALVEPAAAARMPPEPLAWAGAEIVRAATLRAEAREDEGAGADPVSRFVSGLPRRLGIRLGR